MTWLASILQDLHYGLRVLFRNASFTAVAVLALALGIGLNTAVFTAYKALLARGIDARDTASMVNLVMVRQSGWVDADFSFPDYEEYRDRLRSFSGLIAIGPQFDALILTGAGGDERREAAGGSLIEQLGLLPGWQSRTHAEQATASIVSENYFSVLGIAAIRGRVFTAQDKAELAKSPAVLISENYWQARFGGDPSILGKAIRLNGAAFTIIGITPHDFVGTSVGVPDLWMPQSLAPLVHPSDRTLRDRNSQCCRLFGRLAPGVSMRDAQAELNLLADHMRSLHDPDSDLSKPAEALLSPASPFPHRLPPEARFAVFLIMLAAGLVLVIACANVASLQLARAAARQNELGLRMSLGARRSRLVRQLLTENALLGLIAGALAFLASWAATAALARVTEDVLPPDMGTFVVHVRPDFETFAYVLAISLVAGVLFGLAPALESSRTALAAALKANAAISPARGRRLRNVLLSAQVAVSLVLLIAGSMLVHGSVRALKMDTGYEGQHVIDLNLQFPDTPEYSARRKAALTRTISGRMAALPAVLAVTSGRAPDDSNLRGAGVSLDGQKPTTRNARAYLYYSYVRPNYFATLGIPLLFGRGFQVQAGEPEPVAIVSESVAKGLWPGQNPIGRTLRLGTDLFGWHPPGEIVPDGREYEVIGVARETRGVMMDGSDSDQVYLPIPQDSLDEFPILIRTREDPAHAMDAIRPVLDGIDANMVVTTSTLEQMLRQTQAFAVSSVLALIAITIGIFGLVLASMGIFGTVSYMVVLRTREVGIRMALGARRGQIAALMVRDSTRPVIVGLLVGLALATADSYLLRKVLYGLGAFDGISYAGVSLLLLAIALVAAYVPSRRAMRVDPMAALRYE